MYFIDFRKGEEKRRLKRTVAFLSILVLYDFQRPCRSAMPLRPMRENDRDEAMKLPHHVKNIENQLIIMTELSLHGLHKV